MLPRHSSNWLGIGNHGARLSSRGKARARPDTGRAQRDLPTERKYVTILRVDLHRSTDLLAGLELEEAIGRLEPALVAMREAVHAYNGIVYRELGDGIFAAFGAPVAEDLHAVMGCLAALDVLARIEAIGDPAFRVRIGVHSGQVVAGPRRLDFSSSYEFDGPVLIMVERLQSVAEPGQILCSSDCRMLAEGYVKFGAELMHNLKGFAEPVKCHVVESVGEFSKGRIAAARPSSDFVGRDGEMAQLREFARRAEEEKRGACVALVGEAGVGKSRLAREYLDTLRPRDSRPSAARSSARLPLHC